MKKRCISLLLVLLMALTLLPTEALALLGGSIGNLREVIQPVTIKKEGVDDGSQLYSMKMNNGKLVMFIATSGPHMGKSVTTSDRGYTATMDSIRKGVYEKASFTFSGKSTWFGINKNLTIRSMEVVDPEKTPELAAFGTAIPTENALVIRYTFDGDNPKVMCFISYYFVELAPGVAKGTLTDAAQTEDGKTYALAAQAFWCPDVMTDNFDWFVFQWNQEYHGFSRMGHAAAERAAHVKVSRTYESGETTTATETDITAGMGRVRTGASFFNGAVAEIYSDSYGVDNPFVLVDNENVCRNEAEAPAFVRYDAEGDVLTAWGYTKKLSPDPQDGSRGSAFHIWGYRNVYTKAEAAEQSKVNFTRPDEVIIPQDSDKLGIYKSGGSMLALPIRDAAWEQALKKQHGAPLYTLRGDFKEGRDDGGKFYEFTTGKVALTPTVTATWNSGQHFKVRVDGNGRFTRFDTSAGVEYNTPTFKLYSPVTGMTEAAGLDFDGGEELTLHMKPEKNAVLVFVNIPQVSSHIDKAQLKGSGDVVLSGQMGLDLILNCAANELITLEKLSYGPKGSNNEFQQNGILAKGEISSADLLGLELGKLKAAINTFDGQEQYDFELELNAFDLFETEASLALERSKKDGSLIPDELWFFVKSSPGIPLVPPVPVGQLNGGGAGFKDLAKTVNGDYFAIPPIKLRGALAGTYMHLIEGTGNVVLGPSEISLKATDVGIVGLGKNAQIIDSFGYSLWLNGQERTYNGMNYRGVYFGGSQELALNLPSKTLDIFTINTAIKLGAFGGANQNKDTVYLGIGANSIVRGALHIPSSLGIPFLSGIKLPSTNINLIVGGQTTFPVTNTNVSESMKQAFKNVDVYLGAMTGVDIKIVDARVWVLVPQIVHTNFRRGGGWDIEARWFGSLPEWDWSSKGVDPLVQGVSLQDSGEVPVMLMALETALPANSGSTANIPVNAAPGETPYIVLAFDNSVTDAEIQSALTVAKDGGSPISIHWIANDGDIDSNADINATIMADMKKSQDDGRQYRMAVLRLKEGGNYTVGAGALSFSDEKGFAVAPFEKLDMTQSGNTLTGGVKYPAANTTYTLRTYLGSNPGEATYLVDERTVDTAQINTVSIPTEGTLMPTGEYYVSSFLMTEKTTTVNAEDGSAKDVTVLAAIDSQQFADTVTYTNNNPYQPSAPTGVTLKFTGNEVMKAEWQPVADADGYRVTIYQEQSGGWVDTGFGYDLDKGTTSIDMALTVGGEETAESKNLTANQTYKVGVSAYTEPEDGAKYYSAETESSGEYLPEYTPLSLALAVNGAACAPDENGVYHAYVGGGSNSLAVTCADADSITVTRMDTNAPLTSDAANTFAIPDFTGTLMLRVNGVKGQDVTRVFLLVSMDKTAPVLTLSAPIFYADKATGEYEITGTADAGSQILYRDNDGEKSVYAAGDGSFTVNGHLDESETDDSLYLRAQDSAGNRSAQQLALVARQVTANTVTVTTDGRGTAFAAPAAAAAGTEITLSATPDSGFHFKEWQIISGGVTIKNDRFTMPDGSVEIKAIFEKDAAPATPAPTATPKPESSPTPAPAATAKPNGSPTPAPAATAKPNSSTPPAPAAAAKPDSSTPPAPAAAAKPNSSPTPAPAATAKPESNTPPAPVAAAKPNSSPTPAPAATAKPESSPTLAPTATAKPDSSPTPAPTAPATKLPVWWVALPIVGGVALAGVFVMRKKNSRK